MNKISKKREAQCAKIIKAIKESQGLLTLAAKRAGVTYWTVWKYSKDFPSVAKAIEEAHEGLIDFAEAKLYEKIREGDNTAIIFYLKTQGKSRGYIERQEHTGEGGGPVRIEHDAKDKLAKILSAIVARAGEAEGNLPT